MDGMVREFAFNFPVTGKFFSGKLQYFSELMRCIKTAEFCFVKYNFCSVRFSGCTLEGVFVQTALQLFSGGVFFYR